MADELKTFKNYCTCGGYAWQMNGRPEAQPHRAWCPQREEYAEWFTKQNTPFQKANKPRSNKLSCNPR